MRLRLFPFQENAVSKLRLQLNAAVNDRLSMTEQQVISLQAPTGSGKTIIMAALIESVFTGGSIVSSNTDVGKILEPQPDAIFVWLSDSPELNEQSKRKIELKADRLQLGQCVTITDETFDMEELEEGRIYFLNTQKLAKGNGLVRHSDRRQFTLWETLENTAKNPNKRLYFIIDEAHRGMQGRDASTASSIMQRFIKGYEDKNENVKMSPMPIIIGMSATAERFNALIDKLENYTLRKIPVSADEVRNSGLLKDKIVIVYPEDADKNDEMVLLEEAAKAWKDKCDHWENYCVEQHEAKFNPVFVIQVKNRNADQATATDMTEALSRIREKTGIKLSDHEVVHTFGDTGTIEADGIAVEHINPADIQESSKVRVVFFKENLSTGWDCPRAEVMMSFRKANDATYIAQLLGRMVRTPKQRHIDVDESLNEVRLFLPYFNKESVQNVVDSLQQAEGGQLPVEVGSEGSAGSGITTLTPDAPFTGKRFKKRKNVNTNDQQLVLEIRKIGKQDVAQSPKTTDDSGEQTFHTYENSASESPNNRLIPHEHDIPTTENTEDNDDENKEFLGRLDIIKFVNKSKFGNYRIRRARINSYLKSLYTLISLLMRENIRQDEAASVKDALLEKIRSFAAELENLQKYSSLAKDVMDIKLEASIFDALGNKLKEKLQLPLLISSSDNLDSQLRIADLKLENLGLVADYLMKYKKDRDVDNCKLDCLLYAADNQNINKLQEFAKNEFHRLGDMVRRDLGNNDEYKKIMADSDIVSVFNLTLPYVAIEYSETEGETYTNHLYADPSGKAKICLNKWEKAVVDKESQNPEFICWLRNFSRKSWALCLGYEMEGHTHPMFPDFLIFRSDGNCGIIMDIIEPHHQNNADSLAKAKALAKYALNEPKIGRVLFIRETETRNLRYIDMAKREVRDIVISASDNEALKNIFTIYGKDYATL